MTVCKYLARDLIDEVRESFKGDMVSIVLENE